MRKNLFFVFFILITVTLSSTTIYEIQYTTTPGPDNTYPSPYEDQEVTVTGIVTGVEFSHYKDNFFIEMADGGPWSGVYVFMAGDTTLVAGDEVEITGTVREYYGLTEISGYNQTFISVTLLSSGNPVPDPVVITTAELASEEAYEGVFVELNNVVVTSAPNSYGEWYVTDTSATPGQLDDGFFYLDSVNPPIVVNNGDSWAILRGCVNYSYDEFELNPRTPDDMIAEVSSPNNIVSNQSQFYGCYPNPFNPETTAYLYLAEETELTLSVYNIKGEKVRTILQDKLGAGEHHITWNGKDDNGRAVTSGVYLFFSESNNGDFTSVKKIILLK
jgi:hypothetical protein